MSRRRTSTPGVSFFAFQDIITAVVGIFILITLIMVLELAERVEQSAAAPVQSEQGANSEDVQAILAAIETLEEDVQRLRDQYNERRESSLGTVEINSLNREEKLAQMTARVEHLTRKLETMDQQATKMQRALEIARAEKKQLEELYQSQRGQRDLLQQLAEKMRQLQSQVNRLVSDKSEVYRDVLEDGRFLTLISLKQSSVTLRDALSQTVLDLTGGNRIERLRTWIRDSGTKSRHFMVFIEPDGTLDFQAVQKLLDDASALYGYTVVAADHPVKLGFELTQPGGANKP